MGLLIHGFLSRTINTAIHERWKLDFNHCVLKGYRSDRSMESLDLEALSLILIGRYKVIIALTVFSLLWGLISEIAAQSPLYS